MIISGAFEHLNDYIFSELRAGNNGELNHPLIVTETCANAKHTRATMMELFFECYGVPSVMVGVDALCGVYSNLNNFLL